MKNILFLSVFVMSISCNVVQMMKGASTKIPDDFYAYAAATSVPPIVLGGYFTSFSTNGTTCTSADWLSSLKVLGAGFTPGTKIVIYATVDNMNVETNITEIELLQTQFIDQGEILFDISTLPDINTYWSYKYRVVNETGAFSKGSDYTLYCMY